MSMVLCMRKRLKHRKEDEVIGVCAIECVPCAFQPSTSSPPALPCVPLCVQPHVAPLSEAVTQVWLADLDARCAVSASTLPSCCFFTFVNTKQTLTCASFSADALRVAGRV